MPTLFQINVTANWGSTGKIAEGIGQIAISLGWRSIIAYGRGNPKSESELIRIGNDWDMRLHALSSRIFDNQGLMSEKATRKLVERIKVIRPDIIHLHNIHGYYLNYKILFEYLATAGIPVVWTLHDCWCFTGHCAYFDFVKCTKWQNLCNHCPQKHAYPESFVIDRSQKNYYQKLISFTQIPILYLVPVSEWLQKLLRESFIQKYKSKVIHNGIDTDNFNVALRQSFYTKQYKDKKIILGVANIWEKRKGLDDFIELSKKLSDEYVIIVVGVSSQQIKELPTSIIGISRTENQNELSELYSISLVFFNPTYEDNFPTTNIESLACGTPVITYRTGGSPEAISKDTGFVVEQGDLEGVIDAINEINAKGKDYYRTKCRERAMKYFRKEDRYNDYINLYKDILNNRVK